VIPWGDPGAIIDLRHRRRERGDPLPEERGEEVLTSDPDDLEPLSAILGRPGGPIRVIDERRL
jgi:hypothetical protein